jgi:small conductance mechanosensitive channel
MLLLLRVFRVGDEITAAAFTGRVREIGLFRTVLITGDGLYTSVPNATLFAGPIVNNSREPTRLVSFRVMIDNTADIEKTQTLILEILHRNSRVLKNPGPGTPVSALGDTFVELTVAAWCFSSDFGVLLPELQKSVRKAFLDARIRSPQRLISVAGGVQTASGLAADATTERPNRRSA